MAVRKKVTSREEIIKIAIKLFATKGYHGAALSEIAKKLDITKAALYYHITNKEDILREILNKVMKRLTREANEIRKSDLPPKEKVRLLIQLLVELNTKGQDTVAVTFEQTNALPRKAEREINRQKKAIQQILAEILQDGVEQGCFEIDHIQMAAFTILGATIWTYRWYRPGGRLTPAQIADKFIHILENGYAKSPQTVD